MKHTQTPWRIARLQSTLIIGSDTEFGDIARVYRNKKYVEDGESLANAQLIVTAVNSHETLVKENEELKEYKRLNIIGLSGYTTEELHEQVSNLKAKNAELLEALKNVIGDIAAPYGFDANRIPNESVKQALKVISKAEGKQ